MFVCISNSLYDDYGIIININHQLKTQTQIKHIIHTTKQQSHTTQEKHTQMSNFLQNIKDPNSDHQKKMDAVLLGGKGQQKRLYAVDETIYGTEEGAKLQLEAQLKAENDMKKKKRKRRKKKKNEVDDDVDADIDTSSSVISVKQSVIGMAAVGALAATASLFLGGKRSQ